MTPRHVPRCFLKWVEVCGRLCGSFLTRSPSYTLTSQSFGNIPSPRPLLTHGNANPAAPAARSLGNCHGAWEIVPFVNRTLELGAVIATFLSILSIVPRHCARLTCFLHPKRREINAVLITPQPITLPLRRAGSIPPAYVHALIDPPDMRHQWHTRM